jgi:hypothetical protein
MTVSIRETVGIDEIHPGPLPEIDLPPEQPYKRRSPVGA